MSTVTEPIDTAGTILMGKYRVDHVLGSGGMGMVVAATHLQLQEKVAIKFLLPNAVGNPDVVERFVREGKAAARLKGEHTARIIDVGVLPDGSPYLVMEYLAGRDMAAHIASLQCLGPAEAVDYVLQACEGLAEAHAIGLVHRDVKPANLFITKRPDGSPLIKILDFGISKSPLSVDAALTGSHVMVGTPSYMSPEQMRSSRDVDLRTDIWGLGVVLYECLAGSAPFEAETFSALVVRVATEGPPRLPPSVPSGLAKAVYRCLEKDPADRFATIAELASGLSAFAGNQRAAATIVERTSAMCLGVRPAAAMPTFVAPHNQPTTLGSSLGELTPQPQRSRRSVLLGIGLLSVVAIVAMALFAGRGNGHEESAAQPTDSTSNVVSVGRQSVGDAGIDGASVDATQYPSNVSGETAVPVSELPRNESAPQQAKPALPASLQHQTSPTAPTPQRPHVRASAPESNPAPKKSNIKPTVDTDGDGIPNSR